MHYKLRLYSKFKISIKVYKFVRTYFVADTLINVVNNEKFESNNYEYFKYPAAPGTSVQVSGTPVLNIEV